MIEIVIVGVPAAISFRSCWDAPCPKRKMDCKCVQKKVKRALVNNSRRKLFFTQDI